MVWFDYPNEWPNEDFYQRKFWLKKIPMNHLVEA